jgi:predicted ATPase
VSREAELARLSAFLELALAGQGRVAFVTGEAGSGKTALIQEFTRRSQAAHDGLLVASGNCNAYTGVGDPYLPFREILELLSGDVEAGAAAGTLTKDHALRLWKKIPVAVRALVDAGPDLIDTFVQRSPLLERAKASTSGQPDWSIKLEEFLARKPGTIPSAAALHQVDLFEQYTRVLHALEEKCPLLLVIDDLQWADSGSVNLLFHLGRRVKGSRILILGAYRSEEITLGREAGRHPLEPVINEFRREFGDILVDVDQMDGRKFIEGFLNSEPHRLGPSFHEMLYHHTRGHPLFTVELLRGLQERGDIIRDAEGRWIEGPSLDWVTLPVRVEAAIQERIGRLPEELQKTLAVASVEGEVFTAEVVSRVRAIEKHRMLEYLSGGLEKKHRLVHAHSIQRVDGGSLSRYRFQHILFQRYLYGSLDEVERVHLHEQVGAALEGLYGDRLDAAANAVQMARHFEEARIVEKAAHYLYIAGGRAVQLSAYRDGIAHLTRGLNLLETLPPSPGRARQELDLQIALGFAYHGTLGTHQPEVEHTFTRARDLCKEVGSRTQMVQILGGLVVLYYVRGEHHLAQELAREGLELAEEENDPLLMMLCHWHLGFVLFCLGEFQEALRHLRSVLDSYDPSRHHHALLFVRGADAGLGAMAYEVCCLWCLGYPDQALERSRVALTLALELNHPFSLADVLCFAGCLFSAMRRDGESLERHAVQLVRLVQERNIEAWLGTAMRYQGEALVFQGKVEAGTAQAQKAITGMAFEGERIYFSGTFAILAEVQMNAGQLEEAQAILNEALAMIEGTDERFWEAELHRLQGEIFLKRGQEAQAETSLQRAIEIARRQHAKSLELRAAMSLCRLWNRQGKATEARQLLGEVYNWFTEGFDTPDLVEARRLLEGTVEEKQ